MAKTPSGNKAAPSAVSKVPNKPEKAAGKVATPAKPAAAKKGK